MASVGSPAETRDYIIERLVGETGEPDRVIGAARAVADRAVATLLQGLADELGVAPEIEVKEVELTRFAEARPQPDSFSAASVASLSSSADAVMLTLDGAAIALIVSLMFGADADTPIGAVERDPSPIELDVAASVFARTAAAVGGRDGRGLDMKSPPAAPLCGVELKRLLLRDTPAVRIIFGLSTRAARGELGVIVPQRALLKNRVLPAAAEDSAERDAWVARFGGEVMRATVEMVATMPAAHMTLGALSVLDVGHVLPIDAGAQANVRLAARDRTLFTCEFGRVGQNYSVRIREPFETSNDIMDGLLPGHGR